MNVQELSMNLVYSPSMKSKLFFSLFCSLTVSFFPAAAKAEPDLNQLCTRFPSNSQCEGYIPPTADGEAGRDRATGYAVLNTGDWRTSDNVPFSEPVIINDPFDGDYLAVIDKNFSGNMMFGGQQAGVITNWSENYIRVYAYSIQKPCSGIDLFCPPSTTVRETSGLEIKVGDEVFRLEGTDGNFPVSAELAVALRNAPPGQALTRITLEGSGGQIVNDIGAGTTEAWHIVYQENALLQSTF
jgi:hypothetical protein